MSRPAVVQPSLLASGTPAPDPSFTGCRRHVFDDGAWVDHTPGWLAGSDTLFEWLRHELEWHQGDIDLYGQTFVQPRLGAVVPLAEDSAGIATVREIAQLLSGRYGVELDRVGANLYRDGRDSVAWHGDRVLRNRNTSTVATVSLGEPRRFLLRPRAGGASVAFALGRGDLLVMGGSCQRAWRHSVPKVAHAGPRMSVTFRATSELTPD